MTNSLRAAVKSLFVITKNIKKLDYKLTPNETDGSLVHRKRTIKVLEFKSGLLEEALVHVGYIRTHLDDCIGLNDQQIDSILHLIGICNSMAAEHILLVSDLETPTFIVS